MTSRDRPRTAAPSRQAELSRFLTARRARLSPDDVGLPGRGRRRTPGLRREEVSLLAGVSLTWYTWLEQGRDINASTSVVSAIARALRLDDAERAYLFQLLGQQPPRTEAAPDTARLSAIVEAWMPLPAMVKDRYWNIVAANASVPEYLGFGPAGDNLLVRFFTDDSCRRRYLHGDALARDTVARFRGEVVDHLGDPRLGDLIDTLCRSGAEFARLWEDHEVSGPVPYRAKHIRHDTGELTFDVQEWNLAEGDLHLILHMPAPKGVPAPPA